MTSAISDLSRTAGLVLAGGRSSRFGAEKALARFRGEPLLDRARRPLKALLAVAISAKANSAIDAAARARGVTVLTDDPNYPAGPLAGVLAGLDWANEHGFRFLATVPCDMPLLPLDLVSALLSGIKSAQAAYATTVEGEHPLCALWDVELRRPLRTILTREPHPPVRKFLANVGARTVRFSEPNAFANTNTLQALIALERSL